MCILTHLYCDWLSSLLYALSVFSLDIISPDTLDLYSDWQAGRETEEDTLILTAMATNTDTVDHKAREVFFASVQTKLRKRGISLRHQVDCIVGYSIICGGYTVCDMILAEDIH